LIAPFNRCILADDGNRDDALGYKENPLQALILYRSHYGTTKTAAESIARELHARGIDAYVADLRRRLPRLDKFDYAFVGAPTRMARVTRAAYRALKRLSRKGWGAKPIFIFDTFGPIPADPGKREKGRKWLYPGAAGLMKTRAEELGLNVAAEPMRLEVKELKGPLKAGEDEKIGPYVEKFVRNL
jgi:flavodoxin